MSYVALFVAIFVIWLTSFHLFGLMYLKNKESVPTKFKIITDIRRCCDFIITLTIVHLILYFNGHLNDDLVKLLIMDFGLAFASVLMLYPMGRSDEEINRDILFTSVVQIILIIIEIIVTYLYITHI